MKLCVLFKPGKLTETNGSQEPQAILRWKAGGKQRLENVVGEGQSDHSLVGWVNDQHGNPQSQEPAGKRWTQKLFDILALLKQTCMKNLLSMF